MTQPIICYKYYNSKKQRLAIKAEQFEDQLTITILKCSAKEAFNKKFARAALTGKAITKVHPEKYVIKHHGDPKKTFFQWANQEFFRRFDITRRIEMSVLTRENETICLTKPKIISKI